MSIPALEKERTVFVDVLRGFALCGVLLANFNSYTEQQVPADVLSAVSSPVDTMLMTFNSVFLEWKFYTLFSILFGYGFGLILSGLDQRGIGAGTFFIRRMTWLLVFGFIHTAFWWFDVLHFYALCGVLLLLFRRASDKYILAASIVFMFAVPLFFAFRESEGLTKDEWRVIYEQFKYGSLADLFEANLTGYYRLFVVTGSEIPDAFETLGRFLLGYYLVRIGFFQSIESKRPLFYKILSWSVPVSIIYFAFIWRPLRGELDTGGFMTPLIKAGILSVTCTYSCLLALAFIRFPRLGVFEALRSLGRMTLTNYLMVSAVNITLLYGIGFGQLGELPIHILWLIALAWLAVETSFSIAWMKRYRYGPLEWVWRQLSYGKRLELRRG